MVVKPAASLEFYLPLFEKQKKKIVLDYGSGNLRNALFLHRKGYKVFAVDVPNKIKINSLPNLACMVPEDIKELSTDIDLTICTFVLNQIDVQSRKQFFETVSAKMKKGGYLLIETKGISLNDIDFMAIPNGFARVHTSKGRYTIIALYQYIGRIS